MGMKNAIRGSTHLDVNDLEGWKTRVAQLKRELDLAQGMVLSLESKQKFDGIPFGPDTTEEDTGNAA